MPGPMRGQGPRGFLTEEEKGNAPKLSAALVRRILSYLAPYKVQFTLVFLTILVSAVVGLFPSIITGRIVDDALTGQSFSLLIRLLVYALLALTASQLIRLLESYINSWISQRIIFDMKNEMYRHLEYMPHAFFTTEKQGDIITRMNTDISGVSSVISGTLSQLVSNTATVATTLVAMFAMSPKLALAGIAVIPLLILPTRSAGRRRYDLLTKSQAKQDEMNQIINETLSVSGSLLVKLFAREEREYDRFVKVNDEATKLSLKEATSGRLFFVLMGMFTQVGPLLIYFAGGVLIIRQLDPSLTVGMVTATVSLVNRLYRPVESLLNIQVDFTRSLALFTRIFDYLDRENPIRSPEDGEKPDVADQDIVFDHVSFGYTPEAEILSDISFTVPGGQMYAVVGPSGSGKSTLVNLIPRLYDVKGGAVRVAGTDVRDFDLFWLRAQIGMVTQETYLFNGTILENLRMAKEDATMEEVQEACRIASIHDFIMSQPDGYDTVVGNRGLKLSGGEKQRICIARVILKDPKILILDEATSALDSISENAIQEAIDVLMKGRTSIVIAHRLSTILQADRILVVNGGTICEQGSHEELLKADGIYRELYETQFRPALEYEEQRRAAGFDLQTLSGEYIVRAIREAQIGDVYRLYRNNRRWYREAGVKPYLRDLTDVITDLPQGAESDNKHFAGFYTDAYGSGLSAENAGKNASETIPESIPESISANVSGYASAGVPENVTADPSEDADPRGEKLVAILDLITDYPAKQEAFLGWFMVDAQMQGQGIGSRILSDVCAALRAQSFTAVTVGIRRRNTDAVSFWRAGGFQEAAPPQAVPANPGILFMRKELGGVS
ncbi:MAG: GNAT family N-acetyltransferase [Eubacteriales bacterium]|nr:GNAT family N-acetyltransferase [Eubacteriales bacterium]